MFFVRYVSAARAVKPLVRTVALCGLCLIGLVTLFIVLQAVSIGAVRDAAILKNLSQAVQSGVLTEESFPTSVYGRNGLNYDMYTDCIAMSTNLGNEDEPLIRRVAATPYMNYHLTPERSPCKKLVSALQDNTVRADLPYFRYWHGHQIYLRPLLAATSLANIHILNAALLFTAIGIFAFYMVQRFGRTVLPMLILPLVIGTNVLTTPASTVHALAWICAFVSLAMSIAWFANHGINSPKTFALVFSLGCVAAFFDILFSPPFAPTFMAFLAIQGSLRRGHEIRAVVEGLSVAFVWFCGFSLSWISKWTFATAVLGWASVKPYLFDAIKVRSFGDASVPQTSQTLFKATETAFQAPPHDLTVMTWLLGAALILMGIAVVFGDRPRVLRRLPALLTPLVIPVAWVEVLRDHSIGHPAFAGRSFILFVVISLIAAWDCLPRALRQKFDLGSVAPATFLRRPSID